MLPVELWTRVVSRVTRQSARYVTTTSSSSASVLDELASRGMLADMTSRSLQKHLQRSTTVYLGVDPSARSLHVGNLLALIGLLHFRLKGHNVIALIGGATGSVGDPSGRSTERNALAPEELEKNVAGITAQVKAFLGRGTAFAASRSKRRFELLNSTPKDWQGSLKVLNNVEWIGNLSLLQFLARVGKFARMGTMLSRESVKSRLDSPSGLSFTEFTYQLLQAYDFLILHEQRGCTVQLGGSDQMGNIQSGIDLIRRLHAAPDPPPTATDKKKKAVEMTLSPDDERAFGVTFPLLTTSSGEKFGKSAGNAVWLDPNLTSPFELYQFFLRTTDEEVQKYLKIFTFLRVAELEGILADHKRDKRIAQQVLAMEAVELVHGPHGLKQALAATQLFYGSKANEGKRMDRQEFIEALDGVPDLSSPVFVDDRGLPSVLVRLPRSEYMSQLLEKLIVASGLLSSKTQVRKALDGGQLSINGVKLSDHSQVLDESHFDENGIIVLKQGKKANKAVLLV